MIFSSIEIIFALQIPPTHDEFCPPQSLEFLQLAPSKHTHLPALQYCPVGQFDVDEHDEPGSSFDLFEKILIPIISNVMNIIKRKRKTSNPTTILFILK